MNDTRLYRTAAAVTATALAAVALSGCGANTTGTGGGGGADTLEVTSWWTSGSEAEALQVLFDAVEDADGELTVENAAVSGGGGANAKQALAARLQANDPPDSWQLHPDGELKSYVEGGQVADISALWEKHGWADDLPADVAEAQAVDGKYYTVPVGVHRGNVLWTNPAVLEEAGVTLDDTTTIDGFLDDMQKIADSGTTAICLGDKDVFASAQLLESFIMARTGGDGWKELFTNDAPFDSDEVRQAVEDYETALSLANDDHSALTWDEAAKKVAAGDCAVNLMGDWAYGELVNGGFEPGSDFGWASFPESADIFDYVGDGFSIPASNVPNAEAADLWLETLMDPEVQTAFAAKKGTIPALTTADTSSLSEYQQATAETFASASVVSSLAHGQVTTAEFSRIFADAVSAFNGDQNVDAFLATMVAAQGGL
jgi:glucose/mannose transport system substrate-binding protein